jgi:hypothetical protein
MKSEENHYKFNFDRFKLLINIIRVFGIESSQTDIYNVVAKPVIESVMDGFNGTLIAYGQVLKINKL